MPEVGTIEDVNSVQDVAPDPPVAEPVPPVDADVLDALAPTDQIWPGGPTKAQIDDWKNQFGSIYVTSVTPEDHIVWRTITRPEYRRLVKQLEQQAASGNVTQAEANLNNEEAIAELVILYPQYRRLDQTKQMAGVASLISQEAMEASGFNALEVRVL